MSFLYLDFWCLIISKATSELCLPVTYAWPKHLNRSDKESCILISWMLSSQKYFNISFIKVFFKELDKVEGGFTPDIFAHDLLSNLSNGLLYLLVSQTIIFLISKGTLSILLQTNQTLHCGICSWSSKLCNSSNLLNFQLEWLSIF